MMREGRGERKEPRDAHRLSRRVISEDEPTLRRVERRVRGRPTAVRVQALRLLKSGAAQQLGGVRQAGRPQPAPSRALVGDLPAGAGLEALLREPTYPGQATPR